jgi:hypothetical protein
MTMRRAGAGRLLLPATLIAAAVFLLTAPRAIAQEAAVHLELASTEVVPHTEPFTVSLVVEDVTNLGAFQFDLTYDPAVLKIVDVQGGPFLGSSGREVQCLPPRRGEGSIGLTCVTLGATPEGPNGSGELATITFQSLALGSSSLRFARLTLTDPPAQPLPAQAQNVAILVDETGIAMGADAPTATPTPAVTPGVAPLPTDTPGPTGGPAADAGGDGFAWALWGPVIGVGVLALALAAVAATWWARRSRRA